MKQLLLKYILLLCLVTVIVPGRLISQDIPEGDIKSVKLHREEWNLSYPVITLGSGEKLVLRFDLLGDNIETYYYTFVHCDKDWNPSTIFESEYLEGFAENQVQDYDMSFNTTVNYVHYSLSFPNEDVSFKLSGNYIIKVYPFGRPDEALIAERFMVSEDDAVISARSMRSQLTGHYLTGQQIDFSVDHSALQVQDPYNTIYSTVLQNGRWDNARMNLKPDFTGNNKLEYSGLSSVNIFPGGNEYRYFDIRSLRYQTEFIRKTENINGYYHVLLREADKRATRGYFYRQDFNGKYYIAHQEGIDPNVDADYAYVHFTLPSAFPVDGDVFVFGELTGMAFKESNRMKYNSNENTYECMLLLKQGWYNYMFAVRGDDNARASSFSEFEGNYYEAENDYIILCYYRDRNGRYDRLIGHHIFNSLDEVR